ncbi:hypothetical protein GCM10009647_053010 [Streptomyces sanglieri]
MDGIIYATMSLRLVRVPSGLHRTAGVVANCLSEDDSPAAAIPHDRAGGRAAARLFVDAGHRRIALVGGVGRQGSPAAGARLLFLPESPHG